MKLQLIRVLGIVCFSFFTYLAFSFGAIREAILPFSELPERLRLLSHLNYVFLLAAPVLFIGVIALGFYQLINPSRDRLSYGHWWKVIIVASFTIIAIALVNRVYLGYRVDQAGYVKCVNESRTSAKSSWRIYAKDINLCKASSGIAGG